MIDGSSARPIGLALNRKQHDAATLGTYMPCS